MQSESLHVIIGAVVSGSYQSIGIKMIKEWMTYTFDELNCPLSVDDIHVSFNKRFTRKLGVATYHPLKKFYAPNGWTHYKIQFSHKYWMKGTEEEKIETIVHETCHIVDYFNRKTSDHGPIWQNLMIRCGFEPRACKSVSFEIAEYKYAWCECRKHKITKNRYGRIRNGTNNYVCRHCKTYLTLNNRAGVVA